MPQTSPEFTEGSKSKLKFFRRSEYYDYSLIAVIILLIGFGLVMLYSTTSYTAGIKYHDDMYFFKKQAFFAAVAIAAALVISMFDYHLLWHLSRLFYLVSLVLVMLVQTPLGTDAVNGARRWLKFGPVSFQPSELSKIAVIILIPVMIIRRGDRFRGWRDAAAPFLAGLVQALAVYICTSNLSTAIIIMLISAAVIFVAHPKTLPFLLLLAAVLGAALLLVYLIGSGILTTGFRSNRILVWLDPEKYSGSGGYQIMQGLYAIASGGLLGKGLGNSTQKLGAIPEAENDMIFSVICEELGIFGGILVVLLFIYLLYRLFCIAQNAPDLYGSLIVIGVFVHIAAQVVLNLAVVLNVIPTTGITLPFVSYGGTSLCLTVMEIAIALSVSGKIRMRAEERDIWGDVVKSEVSRADM